ncbi:hypothetical protein [Paenibacillus piscarius]|uniref:hypothetical protein n=1 Tax=Paenibacillus piscarius TaxID=1089681 RepID=UPI001EE827C3|nr:hypothetical protein [Paenibacillus piscarius]
MSYTQKVELITEALGETEDVNDELQRQAFQLYTELEHLSLAPIFRNTGNERISVDRNVAVNPEIFSRFRIDFIVEWTQIVVPILELLGEIGNLPKSRPHGVDFLTYISANLDEYVEFATNRVHRSVIDDSAAVEVSLLSEAIKSSLEASLRGNAHLAFSNLDQALSSIDHLLESLGANMGQSGPQHLYKMRTGGNSSYSDGEMFHIPFEKRGFVKTNRYSIPGLPCVYLGSTPLICWEELGRPDLNNVQTAVFVPNRDIRFIDLSISPAFVRSYIQSFFTKTYGVVQRVGLNFFQQSENIFTSGL